jgi:hypothetical protein
MYLRRFAIKRIDGARQNDMQIVAVLVHATQKSR